MSNFEFYSITIPCAYVSVLTGPSPSQIVTVTDPNTGQPIQQLLQTQTDPVTGETKQVLTPLSNGNGVANTGSSNLQVVTVQDPVTGQLQQQIVDPSTGNFVQNTAANNIGSCDVIIFFFMQYQMKYLCLQVHSKH